jgi:hypothetical protein
MKRLLGFLLVAVAVLMYVPRIKAQSSQAQSPVQTSSQTPQESLAPTPYVIVGPTGNNWLLSSWYCDPAACYDYVVALTYGNAYTDAKGTPIGKFHTVNPVFAYQSVTAENCQSYVFLETGPATFRLTYKLYNAKSWGMEGLIVPSQATEDGLIIALGYDLEWSDGTFSAAPFIVSC